MKTEKVDVENALKISQFAYSVLCGYYEVDLEEKISPSFPPIETCVPLTAPIAPSNPVRSAKEAISAHLKYQHGTGGGPTPPELKDTVKEIWDMLPGQFERIPNKYDDDAALLTAGFIHKNMEIQKFELRSVIQCLTLEGIRTVEDHE
uniref:Uncharacterized protein n=1 Tax=Romanomermis culicivorax TaxID=13658 RepID=A0A915K838_ROMCU